MGAEAMQDKFIGQSVTFGDFQTESPRFKELLTQFGSATESDCVSNSPKLPAICRVK